MSFLIRVNRSFMVLSLKVAASTAGRILTKPGLVAVVVAAANAVVV